MAKRRRRRKPSSKPIGDGIRKVQRGLRGYLPGATPGEKKKIARLLKQLDAQYTQTKNTCRQWVPF